MTFGKNIALIILAVCFSISALAQESEEDMSKKASELFDQEEYEQAAKIYSTLLSIELKNPDYNYHFGACQLFTSEDKEEPLKYLKFATEQPSPPALAYFYYGLGLHLNYQFEKAVKEYEQYKPLANRKEKEAELVDHYIDQCKNGKKLVSSFTDIKVIQRSVLPRTDFYRDYDLSEFGGKIIVKPEDFMSEEDKKRDAKFLMYFQQESDIIYYASFSDKNETGKDLYSIQKLPGGDWSTPKKLDQTINTPHDEDFPFIHPEGNTMYFASKGHNSMGGYDVFKSTRNGDGSWSKPINMEFAINTPWDDFMFITDLEENAAWFASNRETTNKQVTVYRIGIDRVPLDLTLIKGTFEAEGSKMAKITVEDMIQNKVVGVYESDRQLGGYLLDLRGSGQYKFLVEAEESNAIHSGIVEIPREKGLKQFRQEMKLAVVDGKEQLQIINHFDEPIEDEQLLTADILKKQASLSVNASQDDLGPTVELLDDGGKPTAQETGEGLDNVTKLALAKRAKTNLADDAKELNQKAAALYEVVQAKYNSEDPNEVAEAALAAELAGIYKDEAERRDIVVEQMETNIAEMESGSIEDAAFNAKYTQLAATQNNFKPIDAFEKRIENEFEKRMDPTLSEYQGKVTEVETLESDIAGIDEEVAYYQSEIDNSTDDQIKEELQVQITEAQNAKPIKTSSLERAKKELVSLEDQKDKAKTYFDVTKQLIADAAEKAPSMSNIVSSVALNEMQSALAKKTGTNPALVAFVAPDLAAGALADNLKDSRKEGQSKESPDDSSSSAPSETKNTSVAEGTNPSAKPNDLNQEIERIEAQESQPDIVKGDLDVHFNAALAEAEEAEDPIIVESNKAEIYDHWSENIQVRIDSLAEQKASISDQDELLAIDAQINALNTEKAKKEDLAMASYERIASLSDAAASASKPVEFNESDNTSESQENQGDALAETAPAPTIASGLEYDPEVETINTNFENELDALEASITNDPTELKLEKAKTLAAWANELQTQLDVIAPQIAAASSTEEKRKLEEKAGALSQLRLSKIKEATELRQEVQASADKAQLQVVQADLQQQLYPLIENYDRNSFAQVEDQINEVPDEASRNAQLVTLNKNWMIAIQNEQVKTKARIANTQDQQQQAALNDRLIALSEDKATVKSNLDSLNSEAAVDGPSAPATVFVKGSERFEGYEPVEIEQLSAYEEASETSGTQAVQVKKEIDKLQDKLQTTNRKKDRLPIEEDIASKEKTLKILELKSSFSAEAADKLMAVETQVLTLGPDDPLPSQKQVKIAETLAKEGQSATETARIAMNDAEDVGNKKERIEAVKEAQKLKDEAEVKRLHADLAKQLAEDMKQVEEETVKKNYIILPTYEVVLPVVTRTLNPTEEEDIKATDEFKFYQSQKTEVDSIRNEVAALEQLEKQFTDRGQQLMEQSATAPVDPSNNNSKMALADRAYADFERADSLSKMASRLIRQATYVENEANRSLLTLPEEAYMNILAYYNNPEVTTPPVVTTPPQIDPLVDTTTPEVTPTEIAQVPSPTESTDTPDTQEEAQPFNLQSPVGNDNAPVEVAPSEINQTIFDIDEGSAQSNYSASNPIPVDPPLPSGLMYKVQIGAFRNAIRQDVFKGIAPIIGESTPNGLTRYAAGEFNSFNTAENAKSRIQDLGYSDAFVVAYFNGKRITISEARNIEQGGQAPVAATPQNTRPEGSRPANSSQPTSVPITNNFIKQGAIEMSSIENTNGTFYTVQVGVFSKSVSGAQLFNITPLQQENLSNGTYRYSTGKFTNINTANRAKDEARSIGVVDAFVTAYRDGVRISVTEARRIIEDSGEDSGSTPAQTTPTPTPAPASNSGTYKVLMGTFSDQVPVNVASKILSLGGDGIDKVSNPDGSKSYFYGSFTDKAEADAAAAELKAEGITDAKVVQR